MYGVNADTISYDDDVYLQQKLPMYPHNQRLCCWIDKQSGLLDFVQWSATDTTKILN